MEKNYTKETFKTKEEWLKSRGLGGSSASAILGKNPYMSKLELYRAIVMPSKHPLKNPNESMFYGIKSEPLIRKQFIVDFKDMYRVHTPVHNEMYRRIDKPYMTATLDGLLVNKLTRKKGILEIKTHDIRNKKDFEQWNEHIPENYYIQVLHYLLVMNDCDFVVLCARLRHFDYFNAEGKKLIKCETKYYEIYRDDERIKQDLAFLEKKETEFWENNVLKKVMPTLMFKF